MRQRTEQLDESNLFLESVLSSVDAGVAVVTPEMTVTAWNRQAADLWGLRGDEAIGSHFLNLDIGLPVEQLRNAIRDCLVGRAGTQELELAARNRRGRKLTCRITVSP